MNEDGFIYTKNDRFRTFGFIFVLIKGCWYVSMLYFGMFLWKKVTYFAAVHASFAYHARFGCLNKCVTIL